MSSSSNIIIGLTSLLKLTITLSLSIVLNASIIYLEENAILISLSLSFSTSIFSSTLPISGELDDTIASFSTHSNFIIFLSFSLVSKAALSITLNSSLVFVLIDNSNDDGINLFTSGKLPLNTRVWNKILSYLNKTLL